MGVDLEAHKQEGNQPPPGHVVRVEFDPYDHDQVQDLFKRTRQEFPKSQDKHRWRYLVPEDTRPNFWPLDFVFRDIEDAIIFGLKYSR